MQQKARIPNSAKIMRLEIQIQLLRERIAANDLSGRINPVESIARREKALDYLRHNAQKDLSLTYVERLFRINI